MSPSAAIGRDAFVGREQELGAMHGLFDRAREGHGGIAMLVGEPGIGKTRIARELASAAVQRGAVVLWGRCFDGESPRPYGPWVEVVSRCARSLGPERLATELRQGSQELAALVPSVGAMLPEELASESSGIDRFRLYEAVAQLLLAATADGPLLLVLDDLQWADRDSLHLLRFVARSAVGARLLLIGAYRSEDLRPEHPLADTLAELAHEAAYTRLALRGLGNADVKRYLASAAGAALPAGLADRIHAETAGNPFYIRELFRHLVEEGHVTAVAAEAPGSGDVELGVPDSVRHVVRRRVARLSAETQTILRVAAAFPVGFELEVLQPLLEVPDQALLDCLEQAQRAGLIRAVVGRHGLYRFAHALVRHALYEEWAASARARLHGRIGEVLARLYQADEERRLPDLAFHFFRALPAGDSARAFAYVRRAGERAARLLAYGEAAEQYERALQILDTRGAAFGVSPEDRVGRCELLLALGDAYWGTGNIPKSHDAFLRAAAVARAVDAPELLARAALGWRLAVLEAPEPGTAAVVSLVEEALAAVGDKDIAVRARLLARLSGLLHFWNEPERRTALGREAVALARQLGDSQTLAFVLGHVHLGLWGPDNLDERLATSDEILQLADETDDRELALLGHGWRVADALELGDIQAADEAIAAHDRLTEPLRRPYALFNSAMWRAMRALLDGRFAEGEALVARTHTLGRRIEYSDAGTFFAIQTYLLSHDRGQYADVAVTVESVAERYPTIPFVRCWHVHLLAELGRLDEAQAELDALAADAFAVLPRDMTWLACTAFLAEACTALGDADRATALYRLLTPYAGRCIVAGHGVIYLGAVHRLLGLLAGTFGQVDASRRHFEAALATHEQMGAAPLLARTRFEYARVLLAGRGREARGAAHTLLDRALATAHELGMWRLEEQARELKAAEKLAGARDAPTSKPSSGSSRTPASGAELLTRREREVAALVARGYSNRQIAAALRVADATAVNHVKHILDRLDLTSRTQIAAWAARHGLAPAPTTTEHPGPRPDGRRSPTTECPESAMR